MALFGTPEHKQHMMAGVRKALASPKTPAHLRPHLQSRLSGANMFQAGKKKQKPANPSLQAGVNPAIVMNDNDGDELPNAMPQPDLAVQKPKRSPGVPSTSMFKGRGGKVPSVPKAKKPARNPLYSQF